MADRAAPDGAGPSRGSAPRPPAPAPAAAPTGRPRAVSNPRPVPRPAQAAAPLAAATGSPGAMSYLASASNGGAGPASLPRSHIVQVLDHVLVSASSPRQRPAIPSFAAGTGSPGSSYTGGHASVASHSPPATLAERRRVASMRGYSSSHSSAPSSPAQLRLRSATPDVSPLVAGGGRRLSGALVPPPAIVSRALRGEGSAVPISHVHQDTVTAAEVALDPTTGSPAFSLQSGFAVRDIYRFRERAALEHTIGRRSRSVPADLRLSSDRDRYAVLIPDRAIGRSALLAGAHVVAVRPEDDVPNPAKPLANLRARDLRVPGGLRRFFLLHMDPHRHARAAAATTAAAAAVATARRPSTAHAASVMGEGGPPSVHVHFVLPTDASSSLYGATAGPSDGLMSPPGTPYGLLPTRSFFDFLALNYTQFAGAALWDEDELAELGVDAPAAAGSALMSGSGVWDEEVGIIGPPSGFGHDEEESIDWEVDERTALLQGGGGMRNRGSRQGSRVSSRVATPIQSPTALIHPPLTAPVPSTPAGTASSRKVFLLLIKSFIGTGVLFLPSAFRDGGLSFSFLFLVFIAWLSARGMLLLARVNARVPGSFGDVAATLYGQPMRVLVLSSIATSQLGFATAYMVFIAQNAAGFMRQVGLAEASMGALIAAQVLIYVPFALVRRIKTFAAMSLVGDVFILGGLAVVVAAAVQTMRERGGPAPDVIYGFNPQSFALYIGTSVYTFEGIGLVIPIAQSMRTPRNFGRVLSLTMALTTAVYLFVASCGYLAWGNDIQTIVLLNLPVSHTSQTVFVLYMIAIVFTWPLVIFPATRIIEQSVFPAHISGKTSAAHKWAKNTLRTALVMGIALGAFIGADQLNRLVAFIGSFCCIPLSFLYPAMFSLRAFPEQGWVNKASDWFMLAFGSVAMVYVTYMTLFV